MLWPVNLKTTAANIFPKVSLLNYVDPTHNNKGENLIVKEDTP